MEARVITILNRLHRKDSVTGLDVWYKTILHDIPYTVEKVTTMTDTRLRMGQSFNILIPFLSEYKDYRTWKEAPDIGFTMSQGDYIFIGVEIEDEITPNNVQKLKDQYSQSVCEVQTIFEVPKKFDAKYRLKVSGI
nr:MAG TPA: hypothetical protein [Caudoviricetes sp.]